VAAEESTGMKTLENLTKNLLAMHRVKEKR
jgi:hypothetical protein